MTAHYTITCDGPGCDQTHTRRNHQIAHQTAAARGWQLHSWLKNRHYCSPQCRINDKDNPDG